MSKDKKNVGCGGCLIFILFIFVFWAILFGIQIGDHKWKIGIFPPEITDISKKNKK
jgi:hypothetical protein